MGVLGGGAVMGVSWVMHERVFQYRDTSGLKKVKIKKGDLVWRVKTLRFVLSDSFLSLPVSSRYAQ